MIRNTFWTLLLLLLLPALGRAQTHTLSLTVLDVEDERPLAFVSVQLSPDGPSGTTNERGILILSVKPGRYTLRASSTGYSPFEEQVTVDDDLEATLRMQASTEQLQTVTVTDRDAQQDLRRPRMGVERLSSEQINSIPSVLGERDVLRSLQLLPGVTSAGEASNGVSIRGGTIDQNLLLMDGAPVFTPTHLFGLFTVFTPDAVGGVDLYRGNVPARFGGRVAAVLDVHSKTPSMENTEIRGGIGFVASELSLETPLGSKRRWGLLVAARGGFNDFVFPLIKRLKNTRSRFGDATVKLRYRLGERDFITGTGFYSQDYYQVDLLSSIAGIPATANAYAYLTLNGGIEWLHQFNDVLSLKTSATHANYTPRLLFPQSDDTEISFRSAINYTTLDASLSADLPQHSLIGGLQFHDYVLEPGTLDPGGSTSVNPITLESEAATETVAYLEDEWTLNERLTVSGGLRYVAYRQLGPGENRRYVEGAELTRENLLERQEVGSGETLTNYGGLEPRLGISYRFSERTSFKAAYARSRQYLQNIYNATTPLPTSRWKVSDVNLGPQTADLLTAGISHLGRDAKYSIQLETYYRSIDAILEYKPGADFFLNPTVETDLLRGEGTAYGAEVTLRRLTGRITGELNYAYARSLNRVNGTTFSTRINRGEEYPGYFDQPHSFSLNLTLDEGKTHELGFNFIAQSNRPYTAPNGFVEVSGTPVPLFLERNNARLPVYHRLDFSWTIHNLRRESRRWTGEWIFTVYNVYGRDNAYNIFFQPKTANTPALGIFSSSPFAAYRLAIFGEPILSLAYKFTFRP